MARELPAARGGLRSALVRGVAWTAGANAAASVLNAVVGLALARLLVPADFGIQAAIVTVTAYFATIIDAGLGSAVVQRENLDRAELSSVFWAGLAASGVVYLLVAASSPLAARLFSSSALVVALPVAALNIIALGTAIVPAALLRRQLHFAVLARAQGAGALAGAVVAMGVAFRGGHYWAFIGYSLTSAITSSALAYRWSGFTPVRTLQLAHLAKVRGYAGSMMSFLTVNYWSRNLDDLLIGRFLGIAQLGFYSLAQRVVGTPLQLLTGSIAPLLHPTFAAMGDDVPRQRSAYLDLMRVTALLTFSLAAMLWVLADPLVLAVAGAAWLPAAPVVRAMAVLAAIQPVNMLSGAVFMARDSAHLMFRCALVGAAAVMAGMVCGLPYGITGVAWGYSIAYLLVSAPVSTLVAFRLLQGSPAELASTLAVPLAIGLAVLVFELGLAALLAGRLPPLVSLAAMLCLSALTLGLVAAPTLRRLHGATLVRRAAASA